MTWFDVNILCGKVFLQFFYVKIHFFFGSESPSLNRQQLCKISFWENNAFSYLALNVQWAYSIKACRTILFRGPILATPWMGTMVHLKSCKGSEFDYKFMLVYQHGWNIRNIYIISVICTVYISYKVYTTYMLYINFVN